MTPHNINSFFDVMVDIAKKLSQLVDLGVVADTRGRVIAEMWEKMEQNMKEKEVGSFTYKENVGYVKDDKNQVIIAKDLCHYDWWRLENGTYAKVYKTVLEGEIYQEDGKPLQKGTWNPLSLKGIEVSNLMNRKTGDNPQGWPKWCK